jgi:hypothetical protein
MTNNKVNLDYNIENDIKVNIESFNKFKNLSIYSIGQILGINPFLMGPHLGIATLVKEMYAFTGLENLIKKYKQNSISIKTVRLQENGIPKESMSFEQIDFQKVSEETWDDSFIKRKFKNTTFLIVVFQIQGEVLYYKGIKNWKMPKEILESEIKSFWTHLHTRILEGVTLTPVKQKNNTIVENNLPSSIDNKVMHTRPKANDSNDKTELPDGQLITKHSYWLNSSFIGQVVSDLPQLKVESSIENSVPKLSSREYEIIESTIQNTIYTIQDFFEIVKDQLPNFNLFQITDNFLNEIGFKIHPPYVYSRKYKKVNDYFDEVIFRNPYFVLSNKEVFQTDFFQRYLKKLENSLSIVKVDKSSYITNNAMESAGLRKQDLESFQSTVLTATNNKDYFSYKKLIKDGFFHDIFEYGFDSIFYESLISQISNLKSIKIIDTKFFKKSNRSIKSEDFFINILEEKKEVSLKLSELVDTFDEYYSEVLTHDSLEKVLLKYNKKPYYSSDLARLFIDKTEFVNYLQ